MALSSPIAAFSKGLVSQLKPKMIIAVLLPFLVTLFFIIILLSTAWGPLSDFFMQSANGSSWMQSVSQSLSGWGGTIGGWLASLFALITLCAISAILGLAVASVLVTPMILKTLSATNYPELVRLGDNSITAGLGNTIKVTLIFIAGWIITLPLWFIPFMPIVLSLFWGAYAFSHMTRVDVIVEHANKDELQNVIKQGNKGFWTIGLVCMALTLIPFVGLIMPVFSILVCAHYGLASLEKLRLDQKQITNQ